MDKLGKYVLIAESIILCRWIGGRMPHLLEWDVAGCRGGFIEYDLIGFSFPFKDGPLSCPAVTLS